MSAQALGLMDMLKAEMSYSAERQKVLAQNIASIDIPGYKALDLKPLDFKNVLSLQNTQLGLTVTSDKHLNGSHPLTARFKSEVERDPFERNPTGGTVVVEEQMMKVADNATHYQMSTGLFKKINNLYREALGLPAIT